jgi:hypothetical protein
VLQVAALLKAGSLRPQAMVTSEEDEVTMTAGALLQAHAAAMAAAGHADLLPPQPQPQAAPHLPPQQQQPSQQPPQQPPQQQQQQKPSELPARAAPEDDGSASPYDPFEIEDAGGDAAPGAAGQGGSSSQQGDEGAQEREYDPASPRHSFGAGAPQRCPPTPPTHTCALPQPLPPPPSCNPQQQQCSHAPVSGAPRPGRSPAAGLPAQQAAGGSLRMQFTGCSR